ncbi:Tol-Pal system beta propeller repeat protein TolB [Sphingomonas sp. LY160]|uniref:Tol-Pal system beta propeller repeat protein TolB n=1 Tax=Sphingomonas sp. LY160 TaxID=3095342 RepID=UPI002ADEC28C|nr:Tol-Pal system beta propeller repeat protein TolB [Sphingomonas sp. LY160]MEA1072743.1 Tol-Pal system beta propeller repeat protein TolB [Sphingomonas sp. LY160]
MSIRLIALLTLLAPMPALAQEEPPPVEVEIVGGGVKGNVTIAVPAIPSQAGPGDGVGRQIAEVISADLRSTGLFTPLGPNGVATYGAAQAATPAYPTWRAAGASALVSGYVESGAGGRLTLACYLFDVTAGRELARQGFAVNAGDWRRAAHKCADLVYSRLSGEQPFLDTRVVYVAETGPKNARVKRIAIMDSDGSNHRYLTPGQATVLTPRFSPRGDKLVYMSYQGRRPRVYVMDMASGSTRLLVPGTAFTFAPRFSPDGNRIVFSMASGGNTDIYVVGANGGTPQRLTSTPGADTAPSFSPDGRRITFESDRSGSQQIYVMNDDGSGQRRISFGGGAFATPVWSPRGDLIAFTKIGGGAFRVGVMNSSGGGERLLTNAWQDEGPSWAPNGQFVMFHRTAQGSGNATLYSVSINGGQPRRMPTPVGGSDPSWSPLND